MAGTQVPQQGSRIIARRAAGVHVWRFRGRQEGIQRNLRHRSQQSQSVADRAERHRRQPDRRCQSTRRETRHPASARAGTASCTEETAKQRRPIRRDRKPDAGRRNTHQRGRRPAGGQGRPARRTRIHEDGELRVCAGQGSCHQDFRGTRGGSGSRRNIDDHRRDRSGWYGSRRKRRNWRCC